MTAQNKKLELYLRNVLKTLSAPPRTDPLPFDQLNDLRLTLARFIESNNRTVSVETQQGAKRINIRQLIVPARLSTTISGNGKRHVESLAGTPTLSFTQFKANTGRAVVLGDPGGGKSTFSQMLCYDLANSITLDGNFNIDRKLIDLSLLKLPLKIVLRTFEKRYKNDNGYDFIDYLVDDLKTAIDSDVTLTKRALLQLLSVGSAFLIFDGLDEILDIDSRRFIVNRVESFVAVYAACPSLVTSRIVGYRERR
jgi:predicted NACHT family NTPase